MAVPIKERPIIFNARDVRAILDGRKAHVRVALPRVYVQRLDPPRCADDVYVGYPFICGFDGNDECISAVYLCPLGTRGDRLWVRETWCGKCDEHGMLMWHDDGNSYAVHYRADGETVVKLDGDGFLACRADGSEASPWRSPISMPRWASRITLEITEVRVQRLQDISEDDARAEGFFSSDGAPDTCGMSTEMVVEARNEFMHSWDSTAKFGARWKDNPWVWAVTFKRVEA